MLGFHYHWLRRRYSRSTIKTKKLLFVLYCSLLFVPLSPEEKNDVMEIKKSAFVISTPSVGQCPQDTKAEFAFIGRSNVGKSSLINMLCNHKGLAKTSAMPGKTMLINHFIINNE